MSKVAQQITYRHALYSAAPVPRSDRYQRILDEGHGARAHAGAFDRAAKELTGKEKINCEDVRVLFGVMEAELAGACSNDALDGELRTFAEEWGFKIEEDAIALITTRIGAVNLAPMGENPTSRSQANGQFYAAVEDGKISEAEAASLLTTPHGTGPVGRAFDQNLQRLYETDDVQWEGNALVAFRAGLQDKHWLRAVDFKRGVQRALGDGDVDRLIQLARKLFPEGRAAARRELRSALRALGVDPADAGTAQQTCDALEAGLDGNGALDRAVTAINGQDRVGPADIEALTEIARWVDGSELSTQVRGALISGLGMEQPYWHDPAFDESAVIALDELIHGPDAAEFRRLVFDGDLLTLLARGYEILRESDRTISAEAGDPDEDDQRRVRLSYGAVEVVIEVDGFLPNGETMTLRTGPLIDVPRGAQAPTLEEIAADASLCNAVKRAFHDAIVEGVPRPDDASSARDFSWNDYWTERASPRRSDSPWEDCILGRADQDSALDADGRRELQEITDAIGDIAEEPPESFGADTRNQLRDISQRLGRLAGHLDPHNAQRLRDLLQTLETHLDQ